MRRTPWLVVAFWIALGSALTAEDRPAAQPTGNAPDKIAADMQAIQGRWTREYTNRQGAVFRGDKTIARNRELVIEVDSNRNTIYSHECTFQLKLDGNVRVYTFSNVVVGAGPNLGAQVPGPRSFVYKLDGDTLYEVWGLLEGDRGPPNLYVWKRVKSSL